MFGPNDSGVGRRTITPNKLSVASRFLHASRVALMENEHRNIE